MKKQVKKIARTVSVILALLFTASTTLAQETEKCARVDLENNQVKIAHSWKQKINIEFFYKEKGKFSYNTKDYDPDIFVTDVKFKNRYQMETNLNLVDVDSVLLTFDWGNPFFKEVQKQCGDVKITDIKVTYDEEFASLGNKLMTVKVYLRKK